MVSEINPNPSAPLQNNSADSTVLRIGLVAGEKSGDNLGAGLIAALQKSFPNAIFEGIGGPAMIALGMNSLYDMERLSVMGYIEPLGRLPELLAMKKGLVAHFIDNPPDVFIGIDNPVFNLKVEYALKEAGITTVHYVGPSVWAYGEKRIHTIKKSVDLMLTLFPFETEIYVRHGIPVHCVGHRLADEIGFEDQQAIAIETLSKLSSNLQVQLQSGNPETICIALMPGSRAGEVKRLAPVFIEAAVASLQRHRQLLFLIPCANAARRQQLQVFLQELAPATREKFVLLDGHAHAAMAAAKLVILASGTATLEGLLLRRPMVVCYKLAMLTYMLAKPRMKVPYISLPNLLAGKKIIPEYIQNDLSSRKLVAEIDGFLAGEGSPSVPEIEGVDELLESYHDIHHQIRLDASATAAQHILDLTSRTSL